MIFVDTGYLVALVNSRDELHGRAVAWSQRITEPMILTEHVLWEVVNYFSRPSHRETVHRLVGQLRADQTYTIVGATPELLEAGLRMHRQHADKAWSLTDCISFLVMRQHSLTQALTYDVHFEQAGFEALLRHEP